MRVHVLSGLTIGLAAVICGCAAADREPGGMSMFAPTQIRIHDTFTRFDDFQRDGSVDGVSVVIEPRNQFGDTTRAAGSFLFELYSYDERSPDTRGPRVVNPWSASIVTPQDQREHWNATLGHYHFDLAAPGVRPGGQYVLVATFTPSGQGDRLFDQLILGR